MKKFKLLLFVSLLPALSFAEGFKGAVDNFKDNYIEPIFFPLIGIIFLIGVVMNIGKLWGENRDYVGFIKGLVLYLGIVVSISAVYGVIIALSL